MTWPGPRSHASEVLAVGFGKPELSLPRPPPQFGVLPGLPEAHGREAAPLAPKCPPCPWQSAKPLGPAPEQTSEDQAGLNQGPKNK